MVTGISSEIKKKGAHQVLITYLGGQLYVCALELCTSQEQFSSWPGLPAQPIMKWSAACNGDERSWSDWPLLKLGPTPLWRWCMPSTNIAVILEPFFPHCALLGLCLNLTELPKMQNPVVHLHPISGMLKTELYAYNIIDFYCPPYLLLMTVDVLHSSKPINSSLG